ncbi:MAG: hypothetical protein GY830_01415 [Bacteroidetes bacterium]|nr:hypothetical protein [Bacteroidota bacterium]
MINNPTQIKGLISYVKAESMIKSKEFIELFDKASMRQIGNLIEEHTAPLITKKIIKCTVLLFFTLLSLIISTLIIAIFSGVICIT